VDDLFKSEILRSKETSEEERRRVVGEALLKELQIMSVDELLPYFQSAGLHKKERQVVVTLSFPWIVTDLDAL
ncbi:hypothetical protein BK140_33260, partial [Paenibacillus macerans]